MRDSEGRTAAHIAAELGHGDVIIELARFGADLGATDSEGDSPLHGAAAVGHTDVIELLLQSGVQVDQPNLLQHNSTPLHLACEARRVQAVRILLQRGASVAARGFGGRTAVHAAASGGSKDVLELTLQPQYNADVNAVDEDQQTPLLTAIDAEPWNAQVVEALLLAGADIIPSNDPESSALDLAAYHLSSDVIACIMQHRDAELTAQMLAKAAVAATEACIDVDQDRVRQLEVIIQVLGAARQKDQVAADTALFEALGGTDGYASTTIMRAYACLDAGGVEGRCPQEPAR
jgi:ankyrin repeat protein